MQKVILITGASSGIGLATLKNLVSESHIVYGTARSDKDMEVVQNAGANPIQMDVTKSSEIDAGVREIIESEGRIDVLFNNAGYGLYGTVEDVPIKAARDQFEVNLFGLARLTQLVLPYMRKQKSGYIINTSSIGGKMYTPLGAWYHASKHAIEGLSDSMRLETKQFGIHVVLIEPGTIQTNWGNIAVENLLKYSGTGAYKEFAEAAAQNTARRYNDASQLSPPSVVADTVSKIISSSKPKPRYAIGKFNWIIKVRTLLGDRIFDRLMLRSLKIK